MTEKVRPLTVLQSDPALPSSVGALGCTRMDRLGHILIWRKRLILPTYLELMRELGGNNERGSCNSCDRLGMG